MVATAVNDALTAFSGTCGTPRCDEKLWSKICWRIGARNFCEAIYRCTEDLRRRSGSIPRNRWPSYFQAYLNRHFPNGGETLPTAKGGAQ